MNREQIIDILKNGYNVQNFGKRYIPFAHWTQEILDVATKIDYLEFEYLRPDGLFANNGEPFKKNITYRLCQTYQDKPAEKYEYLAVDIEEGVYCLHGKYAELPASVAPSIVDYVCYANADKEHLTIDHFDAATCRFVVLKKA